jgi:hypothetical protein
MGEGRQPERREETRQAIRAIKEGALALTVLDWDHIDVLPSAEVDAAIDTMQKLTMRSALVWHGLACGNSNSPHGHSPPPARTNAT